MLSTSALDLSAQVGNRIYAYEVRTPCGTYKLGNIDRLLVSEFVTPDWIHPGQTSGAFDSQEQIQATSPILEGRYLL